VVRRACPELAEAAHRERAEPHSSDWRSDDSIMKFPRGSGFALGVIIGAVMETVVMDNLAIGMGVGIAMGFAFESMRNKRNKKEDDTN
jgi:hypothetical protein